jgi:hypothetical protein
LRLLGAKDFLIQAPNDPEQQTRIWIETVTEETLEGDTTAALKTGVVLCRLLNCIQPRAVPKIATTASPFHQRENLKAFLAVAEAWGVPSAELFAVDDLYDGRNMKQVYSCILSLSNVCRKIPGFHGPFILKARATYTGDGATPRSQLASPSYHVSPAQGRLSIPGAGPVTPDVSRATRSPRPSLSAPSPTTPPPPDFRVRTPDPRLQSPLSAPAPAPAAPAPAAPPPPSPAPAAKAPAAPRPPTPSDSEKSDDSEDEEEEEEEDLT